jgi:hypothetical protein
MGFTDWSEEKWQYAFAQIQPTPEAGRLAYQTAKHAAQGSPWENHRVITAYFHHLMGGGQRLTKEQLVQGVSEALRLNLAFEFILEHYTSYIK